VRRSPPAARRLAEKALLGPAQRSSNSARSSSQRGNSRTSVPNKDNPAAGQGKTSTSTRGVSKDAKAASETRAQAMSKAATGPTGARPGTTYSSRPVQTDARKQAPDPGEIIDPRPKPRQATKSILHPACPEKIWPS
jgi:hypothetical protein